MIQSTAGLGCFLCHPSADLVYYEDSDSFAMAGLGPVVPYYSLVASKTHTMSASDALKDGGSIFEAVKNVVKIFNDKGKRCIIAEHGRVPVCAERISSDRHCYHAHLLVFPGADAPKMQLDALFGQFTKHLDLHSALEHTAPSGEYYLLSDNLTDTLVYTNPKNVPRQFLRMLIAADQGVPELADWRTNPGHTAAKKYAADLRGTGAKQ